jgi:voltage-gated potassium channel Kch
MSKITLSRRLRYAFDNTMSKGPAALIGWLLVITVVMVALFASVVVFADLTPAAEDGSKPGFLSALWSTLMHTLDTGAVAGDAGDRSYIAVMFAVTLGGIFIVSILIGLLTSGIEDKLTDLRKGRSFVVEEGHTVILGWSPQVFSIISELVLANESGSGSAIAILAEKDKVEMEDEIRSRVGNTGKTRIVCRTGSPIELADLAIVNPQAARSIIVLAPEDTTDPDSHVIKTLLALTNSPDRKASPYHIVAEMRDAQNVEVARMVAKDEAQILLVGDLIARITVQTCRQSGLSVVYTELLDFGGDEIYLREERDLVGKTFGEALSAYETSTLIGLRKKDGGVRLNPPMDTKIEKNDRVVVIARDDSDIKLGRGKAPKIAEDAIKTPRAVESSPERTLILGWNHRGVVIINELDKYVAPGSTVVVVADEPAAEETIAAECGEVSNVAVTFRRGVTTDRRTLDKLAAEAYDHVITLSYSDSLEPQAADARTLITLLHLRDIAAKTGQQSSIVSEMLDVRNRQLAEVTRADDFIVSEKLVSLLLSQISESRDLAAVFADLFDPEGSELYLKPASDYVAQGRPVSFGTVVEAARRRGEVAIGYRSSAFSSDAKASYGVRVNPPKADRVTFADGDRVIVLAEG